tara:strand:+ start:481 stop:654 length:174 start_codon:yes stop_codon:yes gene_type:complete
MTNKDFFTTIIFIITVIFWISFYYQVFTETTSFTVWNAFICLFLTSVTLILYKKDNK